MRYIKLMLIPCLIVSVLLFLNACRKYLDAKPDKKMVVPVTLQDAVALLDDVATMNLSWPIAGEIAADNYFLPYNTWANLAVVTDKENYIWKDDVSNDKDWSLSFRVVFKANVILETLDKIDPTAEQMNEWRTVKGSALFYRAFSFFMIAQEFAPQYDQTAAGMDAGIPLRLTADINEITSRATNEQTYSTIVNDLEVASKLLPASVPYKTRPGRTAAFALLSRVHLTMNDYVKAGSYADSCMNSGAQLLDYNELNPLDNEPMTRFNREVIFHATANYSYSLDPANSRIDSSLLATYTAGDLRQELFFRKNEDGSSAFRGNYDGSSSYQLFAGLATDEVLLTRAECYARTGHVEPALQELNRFLEKRYRKGTFINISASDPTQVLDAILLERRKELIFRGSRWTDLRRLNRVPQTATTITRLLNGEVYTLPPNDLRYTFQIPNSVTAIVQIEKNPR